MPYNLTTLENGCRELGIELSQKQKNQFIQFYEFLVEKNKVMNLTGITEFEEVLTKHFLDSLACVKAIDMTKVKTIMDIVRLKSVCMLPVSGVLRFSDFQLSHNQDLSGFSLLPVS